MDLAIRDATPGDAEAIVASKHPTTALLHFVQSRDMELPGEINGLGMRVCMENILAALEQIGSERLAADVRRHGAEILQLLAGTYEDMVAMLAARVEA